MGNDSKSKTFNDNMIKCMLAPVTYMEGLIAGSKDLSDSYYSVPDGLTEEQCMLAVLGAILSNDNLAACDCTSSPSAADTKNSWLQKWFMRDYAGGDEKRGFGIQELIQRGRKDAQKAFEDYKRGDKSAYNKMIGNASRLIQTAYVNEQVEDRYLWSNLSSCMSILKEAVKDPETLAAAKIENPLKEMIEEKDAVNDFLLKKQDLILKYKSLPPDTSEKEKNDLLVEITALNRIVSDYQSFEDFSFMKADLMFPDEFSDKKMSFGDLRKFESGRKLFDEIRYEYAKTHQLDFRAMLKTPEDKDRLLDIYKDAVSKSEKFNKEKNLANPSFSMLSDLSVKLPSVVDPQKAQDLENEWDNSKQEKEERVRKECEKYIKLKNDVKERLKNRFLDFGFDIDKMTVVNQKNVFAQAPYKDLSEMILDQRTAYCFTPDYSHIVKLQSDDGININAELVKNVSLNPDDNLYAYSFANQILNATKIVDSNYFVNTLTMADSESLKKSCPVMVDLIKETRDFYQGLGGLLSDLNENSVSEYSEKVNELYNKYKEYAANPPASEHVDIDYAGEMIGYLGIFRSAFEYGSKTLNERIAEMSKINKTPIEAKKRFSAIEKYAEKNAKLSEKAAEIKKLRTMLPYGNRNTEVRSFSSAYLNWAEKEIAADPSLEGKYSALTDSLRNLNQITAAFYERDENGRFKSMTEADYAELMSAYNSTIAACGSVFETASGPENSMAMQYFAMSVKEMLQNDMDSLYRINPQRELSLPDAINSGRRRHIDFDPANMKLVGEKSNKRYALSFEENGKEVKGFFTRNKENVIEYAKIIKDIDKKKRLYPQYSDFFDFSAEYYFKLKPTAYDNAFRTILDSYEKKGGFKAFGEDVETVRKELNDIYHSNGFIGYDTTMVYQYDNIIEASEGSSISRRNVAMTKLANVLGMPGIVAASYDMEITENGENLNGIFMENAAGVSSDSLKPSDLKNLNDNAFNNKSLLKDLAKLQLLDYISGNIDRNSQNMFYIFNEDKSEIIGVQGIDNDFSFGTLHRNPDQYTRSGPDVALSDMQFIPEDVYVQLLSLDKDTLAGALGNTGLSSKEIDAAIERLNQVKDAVDNGMLKVIPDDKLKDLNLSDLAKKQHSIFRVFRDEARRIESKSKQPLEKAAGNSKKGLHFEKMDTMSGVDKKSMQLSLKDVQSWLDRIDKSQKSIWGSGSPQFRTLRNALQNYANTIKNMSAEPDFKERIRIQASLEAVAESAEDYLGIKRGKKINDKTVNRVNIASEIKESFTKALKEFKTESFRKDEISVEDMNAEIKAAAVKNQQRLIKDKEIGLEKIFMMKKYAMKVMTSKHENAEVKKLMGVAFNALNQSESIINGQNGIESIKNPNSFELEAVVALDALIESRKNGDQSIADNIAQFGVTKVLDDLAHSDEVSDFKKNLSVEKLINKVSQAAVDNDFVENKPEIQNNAPEKDASDKTAEADNILI